MSKETIKELFTFSRAQTQAIVVLCFGILIGTLLFIFLPHFIKPKKETISEDLQGELAKLYKDTSYYKTYNRKKYKKYKPEVSNIKGFAFNPNTITEDQFIKLGLRPKLVRTIMNYRNKGGRFYKTEDLQKIWGMKDDEYAKLKSWVRIPKKKYEPFKRNNKNWKSNKNRSVAKEAKKVIEINSATAEEFISLYGIGEKLSANILKYKKMLGGFARIEQLKEVYGVSPETFDGIRQQLKVNASSIKKININEATYYEMRSHPYLRDKDMAKAITDVRKKNDYTILSLDMLLQHDSINQQDLNKIAPYLRLD